MEWQDEGILLTRRPHGEAAALVEVFTAARGRHAGIVPGGAGRRLSPVLEPGTTLQVGWRARLEDHLGTFRVEPRRQRAAALLGEPDALAGLLSATALLAWALPEREAHPALYAGTAALLDTLGSPGWERAYARWELGLLAELGFGLDLARCAVTGAREGLAFVSPKTGRAVSRAGAGDWAPRFLPLPAFLTDPAGGGGAAEALALTGHFLQAWLAPAIEKPGLPPARLRLAERLARASGRHEDEGG